MANRGFASSITQVVTVALAVVFSTTGVHAGQKVILSFNNTQGAYPLSGLVPDSADNLYGTTSGGGANNCGSVFALSPSGDKWTETVLYSFAGCQQATQTPKGTLTFDRFGNLYGVLQGFFTSGSIYRLSKSAAGAWSESIIHSFSDAEGLPNPDLTWDSNGNLYGTTQLDSTGFSGEVFELSPQTDGSWKETVIYPFYYNKEGGFPVGGPIFDSKGNLYGANYFGPNNSAGAVYELSPQANGPWTLTILSAGVTHGPSSRLTFDSSGNLYGTKGDGFNDNGAIFQLSPRSGGHWQQKTVHAFSSGSDGSRPVGPLLFDSGGNLYGATFSGGTGCNFSLCGTVYKLSPQSDGTWKETILHAFESATGGSEPAWGLFLDSSGNLFGTTSHGGGRYGYGTVYEISP